MSNKKRIDPTAVKRVMMGDTKSDEKALGLFEQMLGFRPSTNTSYKGVHLMNDLVQSVVGGAPEHGGDFLCKLIRFDVDGEDNREETLRKDKKFGAAFERAFPIELGPQRIEHIRHAAQEVLNFDGGVYKPGDRMASSLATHWSLLGFEGFRRFKVGAYLCAILDTPGRQRMKALFESAKDPISRAFRPLLLEDARKDTNPFEALPKLSTFDQSLGQALSTLLMQPLSKPALLRAFALGASLGIVLKILGIGREGGRPILLALSIEDETGFRPLRVEAIASFRAGIEALDRRVATLLPKHKQAQEIMSRQSKGEYIEVKGGAPLEEVAEEIVSEMRKLKNDEYKVYWPDEFAISFGRRVGCIMPKVEVGWGKYLALPSEFFEVLTLMFVPRGSAPSEWHKFWRDVRERLGIVVGANAYADATELNKIGVENVSVERLAENAEIMLKQAVRRGVARRLPDSGAEVGGELK